ncbi:TIGR01777 family oxidoreductase [Nocardioides pantholopis]|uniref:TIGR01777 family oxidoreductase n=1 Tax=Nocardioides pantholopis TaxID=2483798 RepID=UPI000FDC9D33|nr:TIGR01777 family oxidoreductase [Nocardioides pantholopis]
MKIVLAGGSGALGRRLSERLRRNGHEVVVLTRRVRPGPVRQVEWDGRAVGPWRTELAGAAVVNLAGELVDRRPTAANVELLTRSRVEPTRALVEASAGLAEPVPVWIQSSTLAIYGDAGDRMLEESAPPADGPPQMAGVATAWEAAVQGAHTGRLVTLRTGIVLDHGTPALDRLWSLARWGVGGRVGPGTQWVSWLHVDDWLDIVDRLLTDTAPDALSGVVHATGPRPVPNAELMGALRRSVGRPAAPPTPAALVRLGAVLLRTDPALALTGRRALPARLLEAGFEFQHPDLDEALADLRARARAER